MASSAETFLLQGFFRGRLRHCRRRKLHFANAADNETSTKNVDEKVFYVAYAHLVMHTGARRSAAIGLRWSDCDFERGFIALRGDNAKNDKTQYIPMSPYVRELLAELPHSNGDYIFPQRDKDT
ncbi:MAG: tyrosine-type recombinase/integrase [Mailhella sp.]|nr:tyrosine-type recombinase/integrase [Mailhella sp.]